MFHDVASLAPGSDDYGYGNRPPGHVEKPEQEQTRILWPLDNSDNVEKIKGQCGRRKIAHYLEADAGDDYVKRCNIAMIEERPAGSDRVKTMAGDMAEHEYWQVSAPHKRDKWYAPAGNSAVQKRPHRQHRQGENDRFQEQPCEAQIAASPAQLDLAHQEGSDHPALHRIGSYKARQPCSPACLSTVPNLL